MANPLFDNKNLGKYPRRYDQISEESGSGQDKVIIADLLQWMKVDAKGAKPLSPEEKKKDIIEMVEAGIKLAGLDTVAAITELQSSSLHEKLRTGASKVLYDLYYGAKDLLSRRRIKTTLTVLGSIGVGVAVGVVLGTIVFPGIGSAVGGAIGGVISGVVAAVGGSVGLGIIGGVVGSWFGNKIAKRFFKEERHYELSKRQTSALKSQYGISGKVSQMMSSYLYNRRKAVKSPLCHHFYKLLRNNAIKQADPIAVERLAYFFCEELRLLKLELNDDVNNESLAEDKKAVLHILNHLKNAEGLPFATRKHIEATLLGKTDKPEVPPARLVVNNDEPQMAAVPKAKKAEEQAEVQGMTQINKRFIENLRHAKLDIKSVDAEHHRQGSVQHNYYKYHIQRNNKPDLPDIIYRETKVSENLYSRELLVDRSKINEENQQAVSAELVALAKAIYESTGNKQLKVAADKDDALAVQLMAAALVAQMEPYLDEEEFPDLSKRQLLEEQAYAVAGVPAPQKSQAKVGFRVMFEPK